jgi:acetate kinase
MQLKVTTSDLEGLARGLSGLLGELEQAGDVRSVSAGAAENAQLESAVEEFVGRWAQNVEALQANLRTLTERLANAGEGYEQQEQGVFGGFSV